MTNSHTIEFRIFRGTLKYSSFMKNLEFVASMVAFSRVAGLNELTQGDYLGFVASRKLTYPHLYAYLTDRQFITAKPSRRVLAAIGHQSTMTAEV